MKPNDLIVIGSGPVGQRDAIQGATTGKRVAVIEKHRAIGGVCIHTSTHPEQDRSATPFCQGFPDEVCTGLISKDRTAGGSSRPY
jgi:NAD(P) transhydrogenase